MATPPQLSGDPGSSESQGYTVPDAPEVNERTMADEAESCIPDTNKAYAVAHNLIQDNKNRVTSAARITEMISGAPPMSTKALKAKGLGHKSNVNTGFLASIIEKTYPNLANRLKNSRFLTAAALPADVPDHHAKTERYRMEFTKTVKRWRQFHFFVMGHAREVSTFGYDFLYYTDPLEWRPKMARLDEGFVPSGTRIMTDPPFFMAKETFTPDELFAKVKDKDIAEEAGWNVDGVVAAINGARPTKMTNGAFQENARTWEELAREMVPGYTYEQGFNNIDVYHLFATESDGRVTQIMLLADTNGKSTERVELYRRNRAYATMSDVVIPVVFEYGDGTIHGSQGIGIKNYDLSAAVEKARNEARDNLTIRNKMLLEVPEERDLVKAKMTVTDQYIVVSGAKLSQAGTGLPAIPQDSMLLDQMWSQLAQLKVGAFLPEPIKDLSTGNAPTATQVQINALREQEVKSAYIDNWLTQWSSVEYAMRRRLANPETDDGQALEFQRKCLQFMSMEEFQMISNVEPEQTVIDYTEQQNARILQYVQAHQGDPNVDQAVLRKLEATVVVGAELAEQLLPENQDQQANAEQQRLATMELATLEKGIQLPVVETDNDLIHIQVVKPAIAAFIQGQNAEGAQAAYAHYMAHFQAAERKKTIGEQLNEERKFQADATKAFDEMEQQRQMMAQAQAAMQGGGMGPQGGVVEGGGAPAGSIPFPGTMM